MGEMKWYALRTAGAKERKAKEYLEKEIERYGIQDQVEQVLVPTEKTIVIKNDKRKVVEKVLLSGFVFIKAELTATLENIVRNEVPNMSGFLSEKKSESGERIPVSIPDEDMKPLLPKEASDEIPTTEVNYEIGDAVKITDGPFNGFSGTIDDIVADRSKLKVIVVIFGRKTLLELSFTQVTKE